jgi:toxin ParE1/3/4
MSWKIEYSNQARIDLQSIYEYIAYELMVPETAGGQINRIMKAIRTLDNMPEKFKVYEEEPWKSKNLRCFSVDKYIVFYLPKKENQTVNIVRIIYSGRDLKRQLEEIKNSND